MKTLITLFIFSFTVFAKPNIVATLPELGWMVNEIGGEKVEVHSLLNGNEDPHFVDATPSFILKVSNADLVVANGLQLEIGWLPKVIQMAGNGKIQFQAQGYCNASKDIQKLQVIQNFNRSMGDVHPMGNPHYTLSITQMIVAGRAIMECLINLEPKSAEVFSKNYESVKNKLESLHKKLVEKLKPLSGKNFMTYHREFVYFFNDYNLNSAGTLEKVPGILPSAAHLFEVAKLAKEKKVVLVLASITNPKKYLEKFKEMTEIDYIQLPLHMGDRFKGYIDFQETITSDILKYAKDK